jgi:hypothetical protein
MAFVLEKVPEADIEKYGLSELNRQYSMADRGCDWVIDREQDVYVRFLRRDRESPHLSEFNLYWKGARVWLRLEKQGEGELHGTGTTTWTFWGWTPPPELKPEYPAMIEALKEALVLYKDNGVYSSIAEHKAVFTNC